MRFYRARGGLPQALKADYSTKKKKKKKKDEEEEKEKEEEKISASVAMCCLCRRSWGAVFAMYSRCKGTARRRGHSRAAWTERTCWTLG